jgi:hypothetical protein
VETWKRRAMRKRRLPSGLDRIRQLPALARSRQELLHPKKTPLNERRFFTTGAADGIELATFANLIASWSIFARVCLEASFSAAIIRGR